MRAGSIIQRAIADGLDVQFINNESAHEFVITIPRKSNQVKEVSNQVDKDLVTQSNQVEEKSNQVGAEVIVERINLTNKQKDILNFCSVPRSASEIMARIGLTNQSKNRANHILPLLEAGYLEMTNPDNPNASNQKYRRKMK